MTREEAVAVLEAFIENPLFSNTHKAAFNIAIHDIKQRHDWDINNLILINKENYEQDREILDKIRTEIKHYNLRPSNYPCDMISIGTVLQIIDRYKKGANE